MEGQKYLLRNAITNEEARRDLRAALAPYATDEAAQFIYRWNVTVPCDDLAKIGLSAFDAAIHAFIHNPENLLQDENYFIAYFRWWARQHIADYCKSRGLL